MKRRELADAEARRQIRQSLDETMLVEAAAGTGKTTELVSRMVAILESGRATVESLVGVTFTEKAAGELRLRLRSELERRRRDLSETASSSVPAASDRERARRNVEDALARLEEARLGTIHGFCAELLRERAVEAGVDPEFQTLDEAQSQRLFRTTFDAWLEETLSDPPEGVRRSLRRITRPSAPGPIGLVRRTPDEGPLERLRGAAYRLVEWRDLRAPWDRPRDFDRDARLEEIRRTVVTFAEVTERAHNPTRDNLYKETEPVRRLAEQIRSADEVGHRDFDGLEAQVVDLAGERSVWRAKGYGREYGPGLSRESVVAARDALCAQLQSFQEDADADLAALLQQELFEAVDRYEARKRRGGCVDFLDLLLVTRNLLVERADVRNTYRERFTHLFVDEFQDTDPLQAEILLLLAADDPEETDWGKVRPVPGKLFLVGDPKQSIYRFRRADVGIYHAVKQMLLDAGARIVHLTTSFRSVPEIQDLVNVSFEPWMREDRGTLQAEYVALAPFRERAPEQPALVALPVPDPHGATGNVTKSAIEASLPHAVGAFVRWLIEESGWTVTERERPGVRVPIQPRHVCLLFRRFHSYFTGDVTRGYVDALEARGVRHLLVGGRSFHEREEVDAMRAALCAIEWPDDELSMFATLRGALFGIGDEELLRYRLSDLGESSASERSGGSAASPARIRRRLHPFQIPNGPLPDDLAPIAQALEILKQLHLTRNERPIADTIAELLDRTRAHAGFALRDSGEQVLANVLYLGELARQYEAGGGISFRGFLDRLLDDAEAGRSAEAPILEDGSDGVRIMTVHKAKGLEFPVVVLADPTESLAHGAVRYLDPARNLCAMKLGGWAPEILRTFGALEQARDESEGVRLAYVAATRARDLLVVPVLAQGEHPLFCPGAPAPRSDFASRSGSRGDSASGAPKTGLSATGWIGPIAESLYPPREAWSRAEPAPGCPELTRELPGFEISGSVRPGLHRIEYEDEAGNPLATVPAVWWDVSRLDLETRPAGGMRGEELVAKGDGAAEAIGKERYDRWRDRRDRRVSEGAVPGLRILTATEWARRAAEVFAGARHADDSATTGAAGFPDSSSGPESLPDFSQRAGALATREDAERVEVISLAQDERPGGQRFGALVHAVLETVSLRADDEEIERAARLQARILAANEEERLAAREVARRALEHPLLRRAALAQERGACRRETPVLVRLPDGVCVDGVVDLAFLEDGIWTVIDYKTDRELARGLETYRWQVALYVRAIELATRQPARGILLGI